MKTRTQPTTQYEWGPFPFGDGTSVLDIRYDPVFKAVFTRDTSQSRMALSDLISSFIGRVVSVETIVANEPPSDYLGQKKIRFDIACRSNNGEPINVEMSFHPIEDELNKLEYYASRLFVGQDIQGIDKTYADLQETYQISILARKLFFADKNLIHTFQYYDSQSHVALDGKIRIITMELEKSAAFIDKPAAEMSSTEQWAAYFQYLTNEAKKSKITEIINREEGIAMAMNTLYQVTADEEEYARVTSLLKGRLDWQSGIIHAERKGRREGRSEGLNEGFTKASLDIARNLKGMGLSISQIAEGTGLSTETIAQL